VTRRGLLVLALVACACADRSRFDRIDDPFDKAVFYAEQDRRNHWHGHSDPAWQPEAAAEPRQVPNPALVDLDSKIHLLVSRERLGGPASEGDFLRAEADDLAARKQRVVASLESLDRVIEARAAAVEAYRTHQGFAAAKKAYGTSYDAFLTRLQEIWSEEELATLEDRLEDPGLDPAGRQQVIRQWLEARVAELDAAYRRIETELARRAVKLRLEAWLGDDPIHLPGYDTLPEGKLQSRDRLGLDLDAEEMARVQAELKASREVADAANAVLDKEKSLREAVLEVLPKVAPELGEIVTDIDALVERYSGANLRARVDETVAASQAFWGTFRTAAAGLAADRVAAVPDAYRAWLTTKVGVVVSALSTWRRIQDLKARFEHASPKTYPDLVRESMSVLREIQRMAKDLPASALDVAVGTREFFKEQVRLLTGDANAALLGVLESDEGMAFLANLKATYADLQQVATIAQRIEGVLGIAEASVAELPTVPEALNVPLDDVRDTWIDLERTRRRDGDLVSVRATLLDDEDKAVATSGASFQVAQFGWRGQLSPAVVLARPDQLAGGSNSFRFAPTLSWLLSYRPRPEQRGRILEVLRPAIGIHSAFLSFDGQESVQIGLGGTLSFWDGRLQGGIGYNLMSQAKDDGRIYYFVGSDLIGLLQALGLAK